MKYQPKHAAPKVRVNGKKYAPFVHAIAFTLMVLLVRYAFLSTIALWGISRSLLGGILVVLGTMFVTYAVCAVLVAMVFMSVTTWWFTRRSLGR